MNDHRCMRDIEAAEVADIAQRVLAQAPLSIDAFSSRDGIHFARKRYSVR